MAFAFPYAMGELAQGATEATVSSPARPRFDAKFGKGLSFTGADRALRANLSGWLQVDTAFSQPDVTPLQDGTRIRRGRLGFSGQFHQWKLRAEYDFTADPLDIRGFQDLYLRYTGIKESEITIGNTKEPVSLEWQTSSRNISFLERALPIALVPPYHLGLSAATRGQAWSLSGGLFGERLIDGVSSDNGWGLSGRFAASPIHTGELTLHLGVSGAYRERGKASPNLRYSYRPESNVEDIRFVNTNSLRNVADYKLLGTEAALLKGPLSLQAEYLRSFVNRNQGRDDLQFDGWYVFGSWFITGESRHYDRKSGSFGHITPKRQFDLQGGWGAWEIAARYSTLDLNDGRVSGGRESNVTLGLNWYPLTNVRLMANYVFVQSDEKGLKTRHPVQENPKIFELRAQVEF